MNKHLSKKTISELEAIKPIFPFENHFINLAHPMAGGDRDATIHYIDEGKGEPIVFVHGNPSWSFYFRKVITELSPQYRCIALDHLGCGLSEKNPSFRYDLKSRGAFLGAFLDALNIEKCHLVVHDWGGAIGMAFATKYPDRVASITVTNTAAFPSEWISWRIQMCRLPVVGRWINYHCNGFLRGAMCMTTQKPLGKLVKKGYLLPHRTLQDRESIDQFVKDIPMNPKHPSYDELKRVGDALKLFKDSQLLILWGLRDFCFSKYFLERWKQYFPTSKVYAFEDADHFLFEEKSKPCASLISQHVSANRIS